MTPTGRREWWSAVMIRLTRRVFSLLQGRVKIEFSGNAWAQHLQGEMAALPYGESDDLHDPPVWGATAHPARWVLGSDR